MTPTRLEQIWKMPYPDFVAFIDQDNSPPGHEGTVAWWSERAGIERGSRVLDLACNTGYSSRTLCKRVGCEAAGIDLSERAIAAARAAASAPCFDGKLEYRSGDASELPWPDASFSHVVAGCCFGFIERRDRALDEVSRVLEPGGALCVAALAYTSEPPSELLDALETCLGYRPAPERTVAFWREFFLRRFHMEAEWIEALPVHEPEQLGEAAIGHMLTHAHRFDTLSADEREATLARLYRDRLVFNENRRHQTCCRWVLRARIAA